MLSPVFFKYPKCGALLLLPLCDRDMTDERDRNGLLFVFSVLGHARRFFSAIW